MAPRIKPEKLAFIRSYHGMEDVEPLESQEEEQEQEQDEMLLEEEVRKRTCRFCHGEMIVTERSKRPRVSELLAMPVACFREAQVGARISLGARLAAIEAARSGDASAPVIGKWTQEIKRQLIALMASGSL